MSHLQLDTFQDGVLFLSISSDFVLHICSLHLATQLQYTLQESVLHLIERSDLMCSYSSTGDTASGGSTAGVPLEPALFVHIQTCVHACLI